MSKDYYQLLGANYNATNQQILQSFELQKEILIKEESSNPDFYELMVALHVAMLILTNESSKALYDVLHVPKQPIHTEINQSAEVNESETILFQTSDKILSGFTAVRDFDKIRHHLKEDTDAATNQAKNMVNAIINQLK